MVTHAREESGFGLIELLMAMVMLNVGVLAIVAAFNAGAIGIARSSHVSTGSALADKQMEVYRGLPNACIYLSSVPANATYTSDSSYSATQITSSAGCAITPPATATNGSQTIVGPDHHRYRIDTYIVSNLPQASSRALTQVTVVVRDGLTVNASGVLYTTFARVQSTFDPTTG